MFVRIGNKVINLDHVVDVEIWEALPEREDDETGETLRARPLEVMIATTAVGSHYDDGGDYPDRRHTLIHARTIALYGEDAEMFLSSVPTFSPPTYVDDEPDIDDGFPVELEYDDNRF